MMGRGRMGMTEKRRGDGGGTEGEWKGDAMGPGLACCLRGSSMVSWLGSKAFVPGRGSRAFVPGLWFHGLGSMAWFQGFGSRAWFLDSVSAGELRMVTA